MNGTITFELEPQLDLEMDFCFIPGSPTRLTADPYYSEPGKIQSMKLRKSGSTIRINGTRSRIGCGRF